MKFRKHKRFFLVFLIAFLFNDFISQRKIESMAVAAPVMQQVVLSAQAALAFAGAAAYVAKKQIEKWHYQPAVHNQETKPCVQISAVQAMPNDPAQHSVTPPSASRPQAQPETYTFKNFSIPDLVEQSMQQQLGAPLTPEQKKVAQVEIPNPFEAGVALIADVYLDASAFSNPQTIKIINGPGFARAECNLGNHRVYAQVGFKNSFPDRRATEQELLEHRLQYRYDHDPEFRVDIDRQCKEEMRTLINAVAKSATLGKICALKTFFATRAPAQFNRGLYQIRYWLAPLFFDHGTGAISNEPISTVKALRPIVEYFRQEYGDAWREELGKYLDLDEFALLLDMADEQGWYKTVNALYRAFYVARDFLWTHLTSKVIDNATNQKIMAVIESCLAQNFQTANRIARDAKSAVADEIFAYFYNQKFDAYGIRRELASDPAWAELSEQAKKEIKNVPDGIPFFNYYLSVRAQERQKIAEEQKNRPCGTGLIKEPEVPKGQCIVDVEEFEQKGVCIQGGQEIPTPPACEVTQEQEQKQGCNYGTQIQGALLSENAQEQEKNKPAPDVPEEKPAEPEKQKWRPQKSEESQRREEDVERAKKRLAEVIGVNGQPYIDVDTHGEKVIEFLKEGIAKGISKEVIDIIIEALEKFKDVEGFLDKDGPVSKILLECVVDIPHQSTVNGAIYEVEVALRESKNSKVIRFGEKVQLPGKPKRDIDIETAEKIIECKNMEWNDKKIGDCRSKVPSQVEIATAKNKTFEFASKKPIPEAFKNWLKNRKYSFSEGP
jgi:hypothetical protein